MDIIQNICVVCLQIKYEKVSVFNKVDGTSPYEKLVIYTRFIIKPNGPAWICNECVTELNTVEKFILKCEQANELLFDYFDHEIDVDIVRDKGPANDEQQQCDTNVHITECTLNEKGGNETSQQQCQVHDGAQVRRVCPIPGCHKSFTTKTNLSTHLRRHNGERPFPCRDCGKTFRSKNTLNNHMRIHTGVKPYMCPTCGKQFSTNKLSAHMRTHAARTHACPVCSRAFSHKRALLLHARTHAPPTRAYVCVACDVRYNHKQSLNKHMRKRHAQKSVESG